MMEADVNLFHLGRIINKNINDKVAVGDTILTLYSNKDKPIVDEEKLFTISEEKNNNYKLIYEIIK